MSIPTAAVTTRDAEPTDVGAIARFGRTVVPLHYTPLIGAEVSEDQLRWWTESYVTAAIDNGLVAIAELDNVLVGVAQRGHSGTDHVIYKLYVHPDYRGAGIGPRLIDAIVAQLPDHADRLYVEQFRANERAAAFYAREGFVIERIEPSSSGNPGLDQVWRVRSLPR